MLDGRPALLATFPSCACVQWGFVACVYARVPFTLFTHSVARGIQGMERRGVRVEGGLREREGAERAERES